ncbi:MAG: manganese efflux pump [Clostridia bacterium]|nr:manganese efflux pump [Clostridia bacterium]
MELGFKFFFYAIGLGIGLAMDAFSVSLANGLNEPRMRTRKVCGVAGIFAFFQALMPLIGWICVHTILQWFGFFETLIPWIALALLGYIGGKMIYDSLACKEEDDCVQRVGFWGLVVQGIATSIDALSVGFTISEYNAWEAIFTAVIISLVTFIICLVGVFIGKTAGTRLAGKADILGGVILIAIGLEIFITSWF